MWTIYFTSMEDKVIMVNCMCMHSSGANQSDDSQNKGNGPSNNMPLWCCQGGRAQQGQHPAQLTTAWRDLLLQQLQNFTQQRNSNSVNKPRTHTALQPALQSNMAQFGWQHVDKSLPTLRTITGLTCMTCWDCISLPGMSLRSAGLEEALSSWLQFPLQANAAHVISLEGFTEVRMVCF